MQERMITPAQLRAGRALLGLSQTELAGRACLSIHTHMGNFESSGFQVSEAWVNSGRCFEIQGLSPLHSLVRFRHQSKLTFGRRSGRLHHYPACGGRGLRKMRPF
jgi:hypothetical protein